MDLEEAQSHASMGSHSSVVIPITDTPEPMQPGEERPSPVPAIPYVPIAANTQALEYIRLLLQAIQLLPANTPNNIIKMLAEEVRKALNM